MPNHLAHARHSAMIRPLAQEYRVHRMDIRYDAYSMIINGRRTLIRSGAMHYFRLPSQQLWRDRLFKLKAAGYNAVDLYFCWHYHSPAPGVYDFSGIRDVPALLQITQELGLWVIARPGPYINAEYSGGGFPGWLLAQRDIPLRNRRDGAFVWSDTYMQAVREWWERIIPIINAAPNVLMVQIENEYATLEVEPDYIRALYDMTRHFGVKQPLFHNDLYVAGLYEDIVDLYAFDNYSVTQFETDWREMPEIFQVLDHVESNLRPFCPQRPLMAAELQAGWYGSWKGYKYDQITESLGREHINISTKSLLGQGLTIYNHYKAIGGTNWDYTGSIETYTSYDFGAPISEAGLNTERLFEAKALNYFLESFDLSATERQHDCPLRVSQPEALYAVRRCVSSEMDAVSSYWLWFRNLRYDSLALMLDDGPDNHPGNQFPVELKPFDMIVLPYQIPLQADGYTLIFSSTEALHQNATTLVLKANRSVTVQLKTPQPNPEVAVWRQTPDVTISQPAPDLIRLQCPELPPRELRHVRIGHLNVILLGQHLIDTFWVHEDSPTEAHPGLMVAGPDMRLPQGQYALAAGNRRVFWIPPTGHQVYTEAFAHSNSVEIPVLSTWEVFDEAPELSKPEAFLDQYRPVRQAADFDANGFYEGCAWYRLSLDGQAPRPRQITVDGRHLWAVFLNGQYLGDGQHLVLIHGLDAPPPATLDIPEHLWKPGQPNELHVFVSGLGHPKGFHDDAQTPQGLLLLQVDGQDRTLDVQVLPGLVSKRRPPDSTTVNTLPPPRTDFVQSPLVRLQTRFTLPADNGTLAPWGLRLKGLNYARINVYLNGQLIGRYWQECQAQDMFYLPPGILHQTPDQPNLLELVVIHVDTPIQRERIAVEASQVVLHPYGVFTKWTLPDTLES